MKQYTAYIKVSKSAKEEINSVKVNRSAKESFDKWCGKAYGKIIECCYKRSLAHKRETKGVKHET